MESEQKENDFAVEDYIIAAAAGSQSFNFEGPADRPLMELQNVLISNTPLQSSSASSASSSSTSTFTSIINLSPFTNIKAYIFKFSNPAVTLLPANQSNVGPFSLLPDELMTKKLAESFDHAVEYLGYLVVVTCKRQEGGIGRGDGDFGELEGGRRGAGGARRPLRPPSHRGLCGVLQHTGAPAGAPGGGGRGGGGEHGHPRRREGHRAAADANADAARTQRQEVPVKGQ